jgi:hypothetical protein
LHCMTKLYVREARYCGLLPSRDKRFFLLSTITRPAWAHQPPIQYIPGFFLSPPEVKWLGHEGDHSSPSSAEIKIAVPPMHHPSSWHGP